MVLAFKLDFFLILIFVFILTFHLDFDFCAKKTYLYLPLVIGLFHHLGWCLDTCAKISLPNGNRFCYIAFIAMLGFVLTINLLLVVGPKVKKI